MLFGVAGHFDTSSLNKKQINKQTVIECKEPKDTHPVVTGTSTSESSPPDRNFRSPSFVLIAVYCRRKEKLQLRQTFLERDESTFQWTYLYLNTYTFTLLRTDR